MNNDVALSRARVSRRRALSLAGGISLTGLLSAACATGANTTATGSSASAAGAAASASPGSSDDAALVALLGTAPTCVMAAEVTQGPYWFDVDSVRRDIREDRPGLPLRIAMRVQDTDQCAPNGELGAVANAVVEIWHCDAGGVYSGFESGSQSANSARPGGAAGSPPPGPPPGGDGAMEGSGEKSHGSYSDGDQQAETTDDGTYLRGAQVTNADGIVYFDTIYPGWYTGRTTHIHVKVHVNKKTLLTAQLYFDDALNDAIYSGVSPYSDHTGRDTRNDTDGIRCHGCEPPQRRCSRRRQPRDLRLTAGSQTTPSASIAFATRMKPAMFAPVT